MWFALIIVLFALAFDFLNGFHDAANSIATVVSTRVLSPRQAVWLLWHPTERLTPDQQAYRRALLDGSAEIAAAQALVERFRALVHDHDRGAN